MDRSSREIVDSLILHMPAACACSGGMSEISAAIALDPRHAFRRVVGVCAARPRGEPVVGRKPAAEPVMKCGASFAHGRIIPNRMLLRALED